MLARLVPLALIIQQTTRRRAKRSSRDRPQGSSHLVAEGPLIQSVAHFHSSAAPYQARYADRLPRWAISSESLTRQPGLVAIRNHFWATDRHAWMKWLRNQGVLTICYRRKLQLKWVYSQIYLKTWCRTNRCFWLMVDMVWRLEKVKPIGRRLGLPSQVTHFKLVACLSSLQQVLVSLQNRQKCGHSSITSSPEVRIRTNRPSSMTQWKNHFQQQEVLVIE